MPSDRHARRTLRLAIITLFALSLVASARQSQPPGKPADEEVLRVTTELVQTDVSVFDRDGKFVDNLKADQFELKVDGRAQPISFFERVVAGSVNEDAQLAAARGTSRGGAGGAASAVPLDRGRLVIFFVDDFHLSPPSLLKAKAMLARFIDTRLGQNDLMAVAAASGQLGFLSQLTDDKNVLKLAAARLSLREQRDFDADRPQMNVVQAIAIDENRLDVVDYFVDQTIKENPAFNAGSLEAARQQAMIYVRRRASQIIDLHSAIATRSLESLRGVMKTFEQTPGRKLVYFVSDGFALELRRSGTYERLRQVTDAAVRAGAVVYTVDARGLGAQLSDLPRADDNSSPDSTGRLAGAGLSMATASQEPLRTIAGETGGRAILNTEAVEAGVAKALKDTSVYYLLAWKPERDENRGGKFRRIEVSVRARPDLTVLVQRGFFATPPEEPKRRDDAKAGANEGAAAPLPATDPRVKELFAALRSPFPRTGIPTALTLNYVRVKDAEMLLTASVQVEIEASKPASGGALTTDRVELLVAIYDEQGKVVYTNNPNRSITPKDASVAIPDVYRVSFPIQTLIKPGLYQVRVASRDPKNRRTGSASQWVEVPDVSKGGFSLSSVFLGIRPAVTTAEDAKADAAAPQVLVVADRRFARDVPVRFLVYAYNASAPAGGKPDVALQVQVFRDDQPVITAPLRKIDVEGLTDFSRLAYAAEVSMRGVPAGRYVLRISAIDRVAKSSVSQSVKFFID